MWWSRAVPDVATVAGIVHDALGERPSSVERVPTLEESDVFRLHVSSGVVFFKAEHEGHPVAVSAWAYDKAGAAGVPVPDVLHVDVSCERWPKEFIIVSAVAGTDLQHDPLDGAALAETVAAFGALLGRIHTVRTDGFGPLDFRDAAASEPVGESADHASHVRASTSWGLPYLVAKGLVPDQLAARVGSVLARHEELFAAPAHGVLVHDDPGLDHVFVDRTRMRITGVIDFEPASADPAWDLGAFAFHYPHLVRYLLDGYGDTPDDLDVRLELYGLVRAVGSARWEHELGFDITRPLDEIARRCVHLEALV
jgi:aminoglycoside phosphotransferase (APT) family kinase protein